MSLEIHLSNRQRKIKIDIAWLEESAEILLRQVCANLKSRPCKLVPRKTVIEIEKRGELGLTLVTNFQIRRLNKQWRNHDAATDVLSFPLGLDAPSIPDLPFELGEIVISPEKAWQQAKEYGHSRERELAFLFVHGCLHVLGFDHETKTEEIEMFRRQKEVLKAAGFTR